MWQDLVDIKVYRALNKLKNINPLYSKIQLPMDALSLKLNVSISEHVGPETDMDKDKDTEDHPKDNEKADPDKHNDNEKDPMVRKVEKDEEAELYNTIPFRCCMLLGKMKRQAIYIKCCVLLRRQWMVDVNNWM